MQGMHARERQALVRRLVREHAKEEAERLYDGQETQRARILAVIRRFPKPSYANLAVLVYGDTELATRVKLRGHLAKLEEAGLVKQEKKKSGLWVATAPASSAKTPKKASKPE